LPSSFFARPIEEASFIDSFKTDFKLKRTVEPGLSVIIPFYKKEIKKTRLVIAILNQYFFPVLNKKLNVEIFTDDETIIINHDTIYDILESIIIGDDEDIPFNKEAVLSLFNFTQWIIELADDDHISLIAPNPNNQPNWYETLWIGINIDELIKKFESDGRIAFKVPVKYFNLEKDTQPKTCWFKAYLEKDDRLDKPEDHFIRENITIIDVKSLDTPKIRGVVVVDDKDLSNLLGDSENPAHTQWQKDSQNFTYKYLHGDKCIQFVSRSLQKLYNKLQKPAAGLDKDILKNLFYVEDDNVDQLPIKPDDDSKKDNVSDGPHIDIVTKKTHIRALKTHGGITIYSTSSENFDPIEVTLHLAYMTTRGKPLAKYQVFDFELNKAPIMVQQGFCEITKCEKNVMEFIVENSDFEMTLTGFDIKRDLFIKMDTKILADDSEV